MRKTPAGMQCKDIAAAPLLATIARKEAENGLYVTIWGFDGTPYGELPEKLLRAKMGKLIRRGLITGCVCGCRGDFQMTDKGRDYIEWDTAITRLGESSVESKNHRVEAAAKAMVAARKAEYEWGTRLRSEAQAALDAADAVMFSEEAIERAAEALYAFDPLRFTGDQEPVPWEKLGPAWRALAKIKARAVVAALRGEA